MIAVLIGGIAKGQWQQCNGPYGGFITSFASDSNIIYAGTRNGIYKTNSGGVNWFEISNGLSQKKIAAIEVYGSKIFIGTPDSGLFVSSNNGSFWNSVTGFPDKRITSIVSKNSKIYVATNGGGVFYSQDTGSNWVAMNNSGSYLNFTSLAVSDTAIYAGSQNGLYKTYNNGLSWQQTIFPITVFHITDIATKGSKVVVSASNQVFISDNNGNNWIAANNDSIINDAFYSVAISDSFIYAGTFYNGIYRSGDNGISWIHINTGLTNMEICKLELVGNSIYAASKGGGVFKSDNNGMNWLQINTGITNTFVNSMASSGSNVYIVDYYGNGINKSTDNGLSWTLSNNGISDRSFIDIIAKGSNIFTYNYNGLFRSTDNGLNWVNSNNGLDSSSYLSTIAFCENKIIAGENINGGIYISTDNGSNWVLNSNNGIAPLLHIKSLVVKDSLLYAIIPPNILIKSIDGGLTWEIIYQPSFGGYSFGNLCLSGNNIILSEEPSIILPGDLSVGWLAISNDNGNNWINQFITLDNPFIYSMASNNSFVFAATNHGIHLSLNNGYNWNDITDNLSDTNILKVMINDNYVFVSLQYGGIWRRPLSDFAGFLNITTLYSILSLYPNPATNSLNLNLSQLQKLQNATVSIYDIQGKQLLHQNISQTQTQIDISSFAKGIYIVKVQTDKETLQSKFVKE